MVLEMNIAKIKVMVVDTNQPEQSFKEKNQDNYIKRRYLDTHQTSTDQSGKKRAQHHLLGQEEQELGQRERTQVIEIISNVRT